MVLRKKEVYTVITPIPGFIPRQLALDILHSHKEVITLNPLVLDVKQIEAPRNAESDEYFSTWYEITERIQVVPGMGKLGGSKIKFNGCFHDMPWGVQSHIYAPMSIDMRNKYRVCGNQPGVEPPEQQEMGLAGMGAPKDGLYLREDIEFKCNITLVSVVKAQMKAASKDMITRMIKKAELLDAGVLKAMIEDGKLKTLSTAESNNLNAQQAGQGQVSRHNTGQQSIHSPQMSPANPYQPPLSPGLQQQHTGQQYQVPRPMSVQQPAPSQGGFPQQWQQQQQPPQQHQQYYGQQQQDPSKQNQYFAELAAPIGTPQPAQQTSNSFAFEMEGDTYYQPQQSPANRQSQIHSPYTQSSQGQPSPSLNSSRPTSYAASDRNSGQYDSRGYGSPHLDQKSGFVSELPTHKERPDDYSKSAPYDPSKYGTASR